MRWLTFAGVERVSRFAGSGAPRAASDVPSLGKSPPEG